MYVCTYFLCIPFNANNQFRFSTLSKNMLNLSHGDHPNYISNYLQHFVTTRKKAHEWVKCFHISIPELNKRYQLLGTGILQLLL